MASCWSLILQELLRLPKHGRCHGLPINMLSMLSRTTEILIQAGRGQQMRWGSRSRSMRWNIRP